jgi:hypothetical protein
VLHIHHEKAEEAHNVRVALATDEFNLYGMTTASHTCWPVFVIPINLLSPGHMLSKIEHILVVDNSWTPWNKMGMYLAFD